MPRSSKAPPLPPEPDVNELIQNDVARIKRLLGLDVNRLALGSEVEGIVTGGPFGSGDYTVTGASTIEFVNVSTSLGPAQGGSGFPAQVTGLTVTPQAGSDTQLNLAWTATTVPAEFNHYNVYRGPTGFVVGPAFEISEPLTNSYQNTGLTAGTTYYYRVSLTNDAALEGTASSQVSGTTSGTAPVSPNLLLHLDGNITDSSGNGLVTTANNINGYQAPGKFGTNAIRLSTPTDNTPTNIDYINVNDDPLIQMYNITAFSVSFWVFPADITAAGPARRKLAWKQDTSTDRWEISFDASGIIYFCVQKAGVDYKRQITGLTTGSWQHICAVFNGSSVEIYKNAVAGTTTAGATQYVSTTGFSGMFFGINLGSALNTHYEGYMDEIQYFQQALTSTQITNLMNTNAT